MRRFLWFVAILVLRGCSPEPASIALAQQVQPQPATAIPGNVYTASQYGQWSVYVYVGAAAGTHTLYVNGYNAQGPNIPNFVATLPLQIDKGLSTSEIFQPTAVQICNSGIGNCVASQSCNPGSQLCGVAASYTFAHSQYAIISSGTAGLQESINLAISQGGGTVLLDPTWLGSTGMITAAKGSTAVVIQDNRSGTPLNYQWGGSAYALSGGGGGAVASVFGRTGAVAATTGDYTCAQVTGCATAGGTFPSGSSLVKETGTANVGASATGTLGTGTGDYTLPFTSSCTGTGLSCSFVGSVLTIALSGGAGTGAVNTGAAYQLGAYPSAGTTIGPAPHVFALNPAMSVAQINTLFASLTTSDVVIIPPGTPQESFTNSGNVPVYDARAVAMPYFVGQGGVSCDAAQYSLSFTSGSNTVSVGSFPITAGMSIFLGNSAGYGIGAAQIEWTPTILSVVSGTATLSSNSPVTSTQLVNVGTDNTTNMQALMNVAGYAHPILLPSGCNILTHKLSWNNSQSFIGQQAGQSLIWGAPGEDVLQQPDATGQGGVSTGGLHLDNIGLLVDGTIDATKGVNNYGSNGTLVVVPPLYRPLFTHSGAQSNNPLAVGWAKNATNGVASITQNSSVICVPNALGRMPVVGYQIVFRDVTSVFTSTITSLTGSGCAGGFSPATMAASFPNTSGYTVAQAEWVSTSSVQTSSTALGGTITYPVTITLANSIAPDPSGEINFAPHGRIKAGTQEFDYLGVTNTSPYQITLRRGPSSCSGVTCSTGFTVVPMNPCPAKYETPWPVIPTINTNDSTPSGATWFPGQCGGNAGIAQPQANGNVFVGTGLSGAFVTHLFVTQNPNVSPYQGANNTAGWLIQGNDSPYGSMISGLKIAGTTFGFVGGPASYGQHGVAAVGPTAAGNHFTNCSIRAAYPLIFVDWQQSYVDQCDTYSTEISPYDGSVIGGSTCLLYGYTLDEQTGGIVTQTSQIYHENWNCEYEGGNHQEQAFASEENAYSAHYNQDTFEGGGNYSGGGAQIFNGGQLSAPWVNYGSQNEFFANTALVQQYVSNVWATPFGSSFINWGTLTSCGAYGENSGGPIVACGVGLNQTYNGATHEATLSGNFLHPTDNYLSGRIRPGEWNGSFILDAGAMTKAFTVDPTEPEWGSYTSCALGGSAQCQPNHFGGTFLGGIWIGPHNRITDAPYQFFADVKTANGSSSFYLTIFAFDSGSGTCVGGGQIFSQQYSTTTAWAPISGTVDFTGRASCTLAIQFGSGATTDTLEVGYFDFIPQPKMVFAPYGTPSEGNPCPAGTPNGAYLGNDSSYMYVCAAGVVKRTAIS